VAASLLRRDNWEQKSEQAADSRIDPEEIKRKGSAEDPDVDGTTVRVNAEDPPKTDERGALHEC
jgi:hypothetical protein